MKLKRDENLPATLAVRLRELGHDADTVMDEGLTGRADELRSTVPTATWGVGTCLPALDGDDYPFVTNPDMR